MTLTYTFDDATNTGTILGSISFTLTNDDTIIFDNGGIYVYKAI